MYSGKYKIAEQSGSSAHFAEIDVEVEHSGSEHDEVVFAVPMPHRLGVGDAVRRGICSAAASLRQGRWVPGTLRVSVVRFVGIACDTDEKDARAAAEMATALAILGQDSETPKLVRAQGDDRWRVDWR